MQTGNPNQDVHVQDYVQLTLHEYKEGLGQFQQKLPEVGKKFRDFTAACFRSGAIPEKEKHLIALGISICSQDEYCILYHADAAVENGATEEEILETIAVAAALGGGTALSQGVTLVQDVFRQSRQKNAAQ